MAGLALSSSFYDDYGIPYDIYIYDKDITLGFGNETFYTPKGSIIITDEGDDNDPFKRIIPKKLAFTILMQDIEYTAPQKAAILAFYTALTTSPEGRFYVLLISGTKVIFRGKVLADVGDLTLSYHRELALSATDGMLQLKDVPYRPTDYDDKVPETLIKKLTFIEHFTEILHRNDVVDFFYTDPLWVGTPDPMFTTSANWKYNNYGAYGTPDIFTHVAMANTYFKQDEGKAYREYDNCYNSLVDLLTGFNMRMYFADGCYHIEQLGYQDNLTLVRYTYNYEGVQVTTVGNKITHNITTDNQIYVLADPSIKHISPFKAITLKQNKKYNNVLGGSNLFWHKTDPDNRGPLDYGYHLAGGSNLLFDLRFEYEINVVPPPFFTYVEWELEIKLGDYYLINNPIDDNILDINQSGTGHEYKEFLWSFTPGTFKLLRKVGTSLTRFVPSNFDNYAILGLSDEIVEDGNFSMRLVNTRILRSDLTNIPAYTDSIISWSINKKSRIYFVTNGIDGLTEVPDNTIIYEIGDVKNSIVYETKLSYFDSDLLENRFNAIWIYVAGFGYAPTVEWTDDDMGVTLPIQELLMRQILGMRKVPGKVARMSILRDDNVLCHMDDRYAIGDDLYIPLRMVHNVDQGLYQISLWFPIKDYDGINIIKYDDLTPVYEVLPFDYDTFVTPTSSGIAAMWRWDNVVDPFVTLEDDPLNFYITSTSEFAEIESRFDVYKNGVRLDYVDYTTLTFPLVGGELTMAQYTVEVDADKFHFAFNEGDTIIIKYFKK